MLGTLARAPGRGLCFPGPTCSGLSNAVIAAAILAGGDKRMGEDKAALGDNDTANQCR